MEEEDGVHVEQLQALLEELGKDDSEKEVLESLADKLIVLLNKSPTFDHLVPNNIATQSKVESLAVTLWNFAVAKNTGGILTPNLNAKFRHVAFKLVCMSQSSWADETILNKQIMMAVKTARAWLDCETPSMADSCLSLAAEFVEQVHGLIKNKYSTSDGSDDAYRDTVVEKKKAVDRDHFKILCYKAEAAASQGRSDQTIPLISHAREMVENLPREGTYLAMLCFNLGLEAFQRGDYEMSVTLLRQSFDIGKNKNTVDSVNQARTLRLLANAYLDWNGKKHWHKALNAIGLANSVQNHPAGQYLKLRIMLVGDAPDNRLEEGLEEIFHHPELTVDRAITAIHLIYTHERYDTAFEGLRRLTVKYEGSPELGVVWCTHLGLLIKGNRIEDAEHFLESCISVINTGSGMDGQTEKQFHLLIWGQAAQKFEGKDFEKALQWYDYSLALFSTPNESDSNLSKLHRNRASCLIALDKLDKADEALIQAARFDDKSAHTYYLMYKIALLKANTDKALESLQKMANCETPSSGSEINGDVPREPDPDIHGLICLAAQLAMEQSNDEVAVRALERLVRHSTSTQQILTATRCLTQLRLKQLDEHDNKKDTGTILQYIKLAYEKLSTINEQRSPTSVCLQDEATWFMKTAWNLALKCGDAMETMYESFLFCCKLTRLCITDISNLVRQKTCLLMATAAALQMAKGTRDLADQTQLLKQALDHITECGTISGKIENTKVTEADPRGSDDTSSQLLIVYEFEAQAMLGGGDLEGILERAIALPNADAKTFETIAGLAMESRADKSLYIRALNVAIKKHLQANQVDYTRCSKTFHSLVALALDGKSLTDPASGKEAWGYYMDVMDVIENSAKGCYPEMEVLWLLTKAWNYGVHLYSAAKYKDAQRWCELGMRLLEHLGSLRSNYTEKMTSAYSEILSKVDISHQDSTTSST